jgi:hypothetical protein
MVVRSMTTRRRKINIDERAKQELFDTVMPVKVAA